MTQEIITEATLVAPVFSGTDEEVAAATSAWASVVSSLSYTNSLYVGQSTVPMTPENKKSLYSALLSYSQCKLDELNNLTQPPQVTTMNVTQPAVAPEATPAPIAVVPDSYAEAKIMESKKALQRMRELAGIPHESNRV